MLCPHCRTMAGISEVTDTEIIYICRNSKCQSYKKEVARVAVDNKEKTTEV